MPTNVALDFQAENRATVPALEAHGIVIEALIEQYYGTRSGGVDLTGVVRSIENGQIARFIELTGRVQGKGRILFFGNGGSYDNACQIAQAARGSGFSVEVLFDRDLNESFVKGDDGFFEVVSALQLHPSDLVVVFTGSGNSTNVLELVRFAQSRRVPCFGFVGRDGGTLLGLIGSENILLVESQVMEAIEDVHLLVGAAVFQRDLGNSSAETLKYRIADAIGEFATVRNVAGLTKLVQAVIETISRSGNLYVGGFGVGPRHFRADAQRGFTNALPICGVCCPEPYSVCSALATMNDDGPGFLLVDGFAKYARRGGGDYAVTFRDGTNSAAVAVFSAWCRDMAITEVSVGGESSDIPDVELGAPLLPHLTPALIGHVVGVVVREILWRTFQVREVAHAQWNDHLPEGCGFGAAGGKKLGMTDMEDFETNLRVAGVIAADESVMFSYGKLYASLTPEVFGLEKVYY
jgi:D-sedoheptulose 7-phosphate isomerase